MRVLCRRIESERGFALVELLVVIVVIGVLSTIALPGFLNQQEKGLDADAKSNARNAVSAIELCYAQTHTYATCDSPLELEAAGVKLPAPVTDTTAKASGAIAVRATADAFSVVGYSRSENEFTITKTDSGTTRTCTSGGHGGCKLGDTW